MSIVKKIVEVKLPPLTIEYLKKRLLEVEDKDEFDQLKLELKDIPDRQTFKKAINELGIFILEDWEAEDNQLSVHPGHTPPKVFEIKENTKYENGEEQIAFSCLHPERGSALAYRINPFNFYGIDKMPKVDKEVDSEIIYLLNWPGYDPEFLYKDQIHILD